MKTDGGGCAAEGEARKYVGFTPGRGHRARQQGSPASSPKRAQHDAREPPNRAVRTWKLTKIRIAAYLVLDTASLHLVGENLSTGLLGLSLVNVLHENTLVLEDVTLRFHVKGVVADSVA